MREAIRTLKDLDVDKEERREIIQALQDGQEDIHLETIRLIKADCIDEIQQGELSNDTWLLGCFNAWFIADNTDLSIDIVQALQEAEKYEAIGEHILDNDFLEDIQAEYCRLDGYGHHFNHYNGNEEEVNLFDNDYYLFIMRG